MTKKKHVVVVVFNLFNFKINEVEKIIVNTSVTGHFKLHD